RRVQANASWGDPPVPQTRDAAKSFRKPALGRGVGACGARHVPISCEASSRSRHLHAHEPSMRSVLLALLMHLAGGAAVAAQPADADDPETLAVERLRHRGSSVISDHERPGHSIIGFVLRRPLFDEDLADLRVFPKLKALDVGDMDFTEDDLVKLTE